MGTQETHFNPSSQTTYRLLVLGDGSVRTVTLTGDRWLVGRAPDCQIVLRDPTVSRRHVLIERQGDAFRFQDLGGSNPILVDGKPAREGTLAVGQTLVVGLTRLTLETRATPAQLVADANSTVVLSREAVEDDGHAAGNSLAAMARRVLDRIEWTFADLGDLHDVAEPLLELALNLTSRRRGLLGRYQPDGSLRPLATLDSFGNGPELHLPQQLLQESRRLNGPSLVTMQERGRTVDHLLIPLGPGPDGLVVLQEPLPEAPRSQDLLRLARSLGQVLWHRLQEASERLRLREEAQRLQLAGTTGHNALWASNRLHEARLRLRELAAAPGAVLLVAEPGCEVEDLARFAHAHGGRAKHPFVAINLAQLADWKHEPELFGDGRQPGALARAHAGTLFVEHPERLGLHLQHRLAEALQPGNSGRSQPRLVLATTPEAAALPGGLAPQLAELAKAGRIDVPPLRHDARDVIALAELFLADLGGNHDGAPRLLTDRSRRLLTAYPWPGNVRELRQVLEQAASRAGPQPIAPRHLPEALAEPGDGAVPAVLTLEQVEQQHIRDVLSRVGGNRARAAQALGIAASTLYEKLKRYNIAD